MAIEIEVKQQARDPEQEVPESDKGMPALTDDDGGGDKADAASKANAEFGDASALLSTANGDDYGTPPSTPSAVESAATSTDLAPTPRRHGHVDLHVQRRTWIRQRTKRRALETTSSDEEISSGSDELFGSDGEDDVLAWCRFNQKHSGRPVRTRMASPPPRRTPVCCHRRECPTMATVCTGNIYRHMPSVANAVHTCARGSAARRLTTTSSTR